MKLYDILITPLIEGWRYRVDKETRKDKDGKDYDADVQVFTWVDPARNAKGDWTDYDDPWFKGITAFGRLKGSRDKVISLDLNSYTQEEIDELKQYDLTYYQSQMPVYAPMYIKGESGIKNELFFDALKGRNPDKVRMENRQGMIDAKMSSLVTSLRSNKFLANNVIIIPLPSSSDLPRAIADSLSRHLDNAEEMSMKSAIKAGKSRKTISRRNLAQVDTFRKKFGKIGTLLRGGQPDTDISTTHDRFHATRPVSNYYATVYKMVISRIRNGKFNSNDALDLQESRLAQIDNYISKGLYATELEDEKTYLLDNSNNGFIFSS